MLHPRHRLQRSSMFLHRQGVGLGQFVLQFWAKIRKGSIGSCKLNTRGMKNCDFRPISRYKLRPISEMIQDTAIVAIEGEPHQAVK